MKPYTHVIWDWNGTLLDDIDWCMRVINGMLAKRSLKSLNGRRDYHRVFKFPIIEYYKKVGFDFEKESFEQLAGEYISVYHSADREHCRLFENAEQVLSQLSALGIVQVILSASEKSNLTAQMSNYNIAGYLDAVLGISNIYAESKISVGLDYIAGKEIQNAVLVGDTVHDHEVARALGCDCVLIARGHQSKEDLLKCGVRVLDDIREVLELICHTV